MPAGLQVWDAQGNLILDTTTRMVRINGRVQTVNGQAGSLQIDLSQGSPWYQVVSYTQNNYDRPIFTLNTSTGVLSWTAAQAQSSVIYGTF